MPLLIIVLCLVAGSVSSCEAAHAFTIQDTPLPKGELLDYHGSNTMGEEEVTYTIERNRINASIRVFF